MPHYLAPLCVSDGPTSQGIQVPPRASYKVHCAPLKPNACPACPSWAPLLPVNNQVGGLSIEIVGSKTSGSLQGVLSIPLIEYPL
jgi:hypothetical protein